MLEVALPPLLAAAAPAAEALALPELRFWPDESREELSELSLLLVLVVERLLLSVVVRVLLSERSLLSVLVLLLERSTVVVWVLSPRTRSTVLEFCA